MVEAAGEGTGRSARYNSLYSYTDIMKNHKKFTKGAVVIFSEDGMVNVELVERSDI